jgi:hypothetical protein
MRPLPQLLPDARETLCVRVHSDFAVHFDGNTYTVPPWAIGKQVTIKADHQSLTIYFKDKPIAAHTRSYHRKQRIELATHRQEAQKYHRSFWRSDEVAAFITLGEAAKAYLEHLVESHQPIQKSLRKLLALHDQYGAEALIEAIQRASLHHAYGAHYIENILYQQRTPCSQHPPVRVKQERLNHIRLEKPSLAEYDAVISKRDQEP